MKKRIITIAAAAALAIALNGCEASGIADTTTGKVQPISDYCVDKNAWLDGNTITTPDGHCWYYDNPAGYTGRYEVAYDGRGTADVSDDILVIALPPEN